MTTWQIPPSLLAAEKPAKDLHWRQMPDLARTNEGTLTDCDAILREVVFSRKEFRESFHGQLLLAARYSRMPFKDVKEATDAGETVVLDGLRLTGTYSNATFEKWREHVVIALDVDQLLRHDTSVILGANDKFIVDAWKECKSSEGGFTMYITAQNDISAIIRIEWTPFPSDPSHNPRVEEFIIQPADGVRILSGGDLVAPGAELGIQRERVVTVERPKGSPLLASLKTFQFDGLQMAYLPGDLPLKIAPDYGVGSGQYLT